MSNPLQGDDMSKDRNQDQDKVEGEGSYSASKD